MSTQWYVLVEETVGLGWQVTQFHPMADQEQALAVAQQTALNHEPRNPMRPQARALFRAPDGGWLVWLEGAAANYHFRVSVVEYYGTFPGKPSA